MSNRSIEVYQYRQIIMQMRLGESNRAIGKRKLAGRDKCRQIREISLQLGWLSSDIALPEDAELARIFKSTPQNQENLPLVTPYQNEIAQWHKEGIHATTIHRALIRKHHYSGSYDSVKRFVQKVKVTETVDNATWVLDFAPAEAAQIDFGQGPEIIDSATGEILKSWFFVMTLCYSRHAYVEFVRDQTVETWLSCHRHAFEFFGGVPTKLIIDNAKCAIIRACYHDPTVQRSYAEYAEGYGFIIAPCPPRDPQKKGRVESGVKYIKNHFLPLRDFRSLSDANQQVMSFVLEEAGNRNHGTTRQKPLTMFEETERHLLLPLPAIAPEACTWVKVHVHGDCHIQYQKCRYSVPFRYVDQELWLRASVNSVKLYYNHEMIAMHLRLKTPGQRSSLGDHMPPKTMAYFMKDPTWCRQQAGEIGEHCLQVVEILFADRVLLQLRAAQGIIGLGKTYGHKRLEAACKRALSFNSPHYKTIKGILKSGLEYSQMPEPQAFDLLGHAYTQGRFIRASGRVVH